MAKALQIIKATTAARLLEKLDFLKTSPKNCLDYMADNTMTTALLQKKLPHATIVSEQRGGQKMDYKQFDLVYSHWLFPTKANEQKHIDCIKKRLLAGSPWLFSALGAKTADQYCQKLSTVFGSQYQPPWTDITQLGDKITQAGYIDTVLESQVITLSQQDNTDYTDTIIDLLGNFSDVWNPSGLILHTDFIKAIRDTAHNNTCTLELIIGIAFSPKSEYSYQGLDGDIVITPNQINRLS